MRDESSVVRRMREEDLSLAVTVIQRSPDRFDGFLSSPGSIASSPLGPDVVVWETVTDSEGTERGEGASLSTTSSYQSMGSWDSPSEPDLRGYEADISSNEDDSVLCD